MKKGTKLITKHYPKPGLEATVIEVIERKGHSLGNYFVKTTVIMNGLEVELEELPLTKYFEEVKEVSENKEESVLEKVISIFGDTFEIKNKKISNEIHTKKLVRYVKNERDIHYFYTNDTFNVDGTELTLYYMAAFIKKTGKYRITSNR